MNSHKCSHVSEDMGIAANKSCAHTIEFDGGITDSNFFNVLNLACNFEDSGSHAKCILDYTKTKIVKISFMPG